MALAIAVPVTAQAVRMIDAEEALRMDVRSSDADLDGAISRVEAQAYDRVRAIGLGHARAMDSKVKRYDSWMILPIFDELDVNRDGKVSLADLLPAMRERIGLLPVADDRD